MSFDKAFSRGGSGQVNRESCPTKRLVSLALRMVRLWKFPDVKVRPVDEDKLRAYVIITLDHYFVIRDLKVIKGTTGYFVSMPSKKRKDGTYKDIAHPANSETRRMIEERVISEYQKTLDAGDSL